MAATSEAPVPSGADTGNGALAQLGERLHGMQEVSGSIPLGSTSFPDGPSLTCIARKLSSGCLASYIGRRLDAGHGPIHWDAV